MPRVRHSSAAVAALTCLLAAGCAGHAPITQELERAAPARSELTEVPFFPQTAYQCGPAALATVLAHEGVPVTPEDLAPAVYIDELRGSLQAELLGATRRHAFVPYVLEPGTQALAAELAAGRPVLVLQNLGLPRLPVWHYAVVVGFDADRDRVILRSGTERRRQERGRRFERSWQRAERWAFVAVPPGELPASATPGGYVRALADAAPMLSEAAMDAAHDAALERWPEDPLVLFTAAAHHQSRERPDEAATLYHALLERQPAHAAARNNLAHLLSERGCHAAALEQALAALAATGATDPLHASIADTVATMETRRGEHPGAFCP